MRLFLITILLIICCGCTVIDNGNGFKHYLPGIWHRGE